MLTMTDHGTDEASVVPVDVDDVAHTDTPLGLDPEAALLCALLHSQDLPEICVVTTHLTAADLYHPIYGALFEVIAELVDAGEPHHPTRVLSCLRNGGRLAGHHGQLLARALQEVTTLGTPAVGLRALAVDVLTAAYRRRFQISVDRQAQAAVQAPTESLFDLMVDEGRAIRHEKNRLDNLRTGATSDPS